MPDPEAFKVACQMFSAKPTLFAAATFRRVSMIFPFSHSSLFLLVRPRHKLDQFLLVRNFNFHHSGLVCVSLSELQTHCFFQSRCSMAKRQCSGAVLAYARKHYEITEIMRGRIMHRSTVQSGKASSLALDCSGATSMT